MYGGEQAGSALQAFAGNLRALANNYGTAASLSQTMGSYQRRQDEWSFQADAAQKEIVQISKQIDGAQIRLDIAQKELANHNLQIANAEEADDFMHSKFTNEDLYDWMVGQIGGVYLQSYQLAYDLPKRAEKAFQFEIGDDTAAFIQFGYWGSLKKGLLAGERLQYDLRRMEAAYLERNAREFEITKYVSLASLYPLQLAVLKATGTCTIDLSESLLDADFPGHYMRRIKSVAVTIPCVTGPYVGVNCRLTLLKNAVRKDPSPGKSYAESPAAADPRFRYDFTSAQSIVLSTGQNDSGLFDPNLRDERYLPFEGAGIISSWRIDFDQNNNNFDVQTTSDAILHLRYTARDGGPALAAAAPPPSTAGVRYFSAKHDLPNQWYSFLHPAPNATSQILQLNMTLDRFPFAVQERGDVVR